MHQARPCACARGRTGRDEVVATGTSMYAHGSLNLHAIVNNGPVTEGSRRGQTRGARCRQKQETCPHNRIVVDHQRYRTGHLKEVRQTTDTRLVDTKPNYALWFGFLRRYHIMWVLYIYWVSAIKVEAASQHRVRLRLTAFLVHVVPSDTAGLGLGYGSLARPINEYVGSPYTTCGASE